MLMTPTLPGPARVTPHGDRILEAIRSAYPEWVNRSTIAAAMGKKRLTPWEVSLLTLLVSNELVEAQQKPFKGIQDYEWVYRVKPE